MYNFVAKRIRQAYPEDFVDDLQFQRDMNKAKRRVLEDLAMDFARSFLKDRTDGMFDPIIFLENCSPNPLLYPLAELWETESE
jgi:hypothetical protein